MARRGEVIEDPMFGERVTFLDISADTNAFPSPCASSPAGELRHAARNAELSPWIPSQQDVGPG
jgi:hypothetical protein